MGNCIETSSFDFCIKAGVGKTVIVEPLTTNEAGEEVPLDLAGFRIAMQVRQSYSSFYPADELTTENGRLKVSEDGHQITVDFPATVTRYYPAGASVYDVKIKSPDGDWERILKGTITTDQEVTKID